LLRASNRISGLESSLSTNHRILAEKGEMMKFARKLVWIEIRFVGEDVGGEVMTEKYRPPKYAMKFGFHFKF